jgi:hypothetical protein
MGAYYTLVTSLPLMPHFARAERTPITRLRLEQRLHMLEPEAAEQLARVEPLFAWGPPQLMARTDREVAEQYRATLALALRPALRALLEFRVDQLTLLAALRRRRSGLRPGGATAWGAGRWVRWIEAHWDDPDFRLAGQYPWLPEARGLLDAPDAVGLERVVMDAAWQRATRIAGQDQFGFEAVAAYVFKWDIVASWVARDADAAGARFQDLIVEVSHGKQN